MGCDNLRYLIRFSYDGSNFNGYQKQPNLRTVEGEFEKALYDINDHKDTKIVSSGRTDAGVHANNQCAHFDLTVTITNYKLKCALNSLLPNDIHVFDVENVDDNFHSRYMAKKKTYKYIINCGEYNPIERNYIYQYNKELNVDLMKESIKEYIGVYNFESFVSAEAIKESYVREIFDASITKDANKIIILFTGDGFMKYQVRNMVGVLIKIASGKYKKSYIKELFDSPSRNWNVFTAPPEGLYLENVEY